MGRLKYFLGIEVAQYSKNFGHETVIRTQKKKIMQDTNTKHTHVHEI